MNLDLTVPRGHERGFVSGSFATQLMSSHANTHVDTMENVPLESMLFWTHAWYEWFVWESVWSSSQVQLLTQWSIAVRGKH